MATASQTGTDLASREFVCQLEGCNKAFVGLFKFATHEKYFHKLPPSERVSRRFMHICPFPPCVMEYVEREALDNHVLERHKAPNPDMVPRVTSTQPTLVAGVTQPKLPELPAAHQGSYEAFKSTFIPEKSPSSVPAGDRSGNDANVVKISENLAEAPPSLGSVTSKAKGTFSCPMLGCAQKFTTQSQLNKHEAEGHQRKKAVNVCPHSQCPQSFRTEAKLQKHIRDQHKNGVQFHVVPTVAPLQPPFKPVDPPVGRSTQSSQVKVTIRSPAVPSPNTATPAVSPQLYICRYPGCGQQFLSQKKFGKHERKHGLVPEQTTSTSPAISCPVSNCDAKFATDFLLQQHITKGHIGGSTPSAKQIPTAPTGPASGGVSGAGFKATASQSFGNFKPTPPSTMPAPSSNTIYTQPNVPTQPKSFPKARNILNNQKPTSNPWLPYFMGSNPYPGPIVPHYMHSPYMSFHPASTAPGNHLQPPSINPIGTPAIPYRNTPAPLVDAAQGRENTSVPKPTISTPTTHTIPPKPFPGLTNNPSGQRQLPCSVANCSVTFTEALDLHRHEKIVHKLKNSAQTAKQYKFLCSSCTKSYWTQQHLDAHVLTKHSTPVPSATPSNPPSLPVPSPTNETNVRPATTTGGGQRTYNHIAPSGQGYSCNLCLVVFQSGAELNSHIRQSPLHRWFLEKRVGVVGTGDISL